MTRTLRIVGGIVTGVLALSIGVPAVVSYWGTDVGLVGGYSGELLPFVAIVVAVGLGRLAMWLLGLDD